MPQETDVFDDIEGMIVAEARKQYSEKVIDHFMNPRNLEVFEDADCQTVMSGMCGDTIAIFLKIDDDRITRAAFATDGCGPTIACGSALTTMVTGLSVKDAYQITSEALIAYLDGLPLENTHCADLAVNTLRGALDKAESTAAE